MTPGGPGSRIRKLKHKTRMVEYLGGACVVCGYNACYRALHFHHRDSKTKIFGLATSHDINWSLVEQELNKCDLLCANCHAEKEHEIEWAKEIA